MVMENICGTLTVKSYNNGGLKRLYYCMLFGVFPFLLCVLFISVHVNMSQWSRHHCPTLSVTVEDPNYPHFSSKTNGQCDQYTIKKHFQNIEFYNVKMFGK